MWVCLYWIYTRQQSPYCQCVHKLYATRIIHKRVHCHSNIVNILIVNTQWKQASYKLMYTSKRSKITGIFHLVKFGEREEMISIVCDTRTWHDTLRSFVTRYRVCKKINNIHLCKTLISPHNCKRSRKLIIYFENVFIKDIHVIYTAMCSNCDEQDRQKATSLSRGF